MKKLLCLLLVLFCLAALATTVYADLISDPVTRVTHSDTWPYVLIGAVVIAAGLILFLILRNRKR